MPWPSRGTPSRRARGTPERAHAIAARGPQRSERGSCRCPRRPSSAPRASGARLVADTSPGKSVVRRVPDAEDDPAVAVDHERAGARERQPGPAASGIRRSRTPASACPSSPTARPRRPCRARSRAASPSRLRPRRCSSRRARRPYQPPAPIAVGAGSSDARRSRRGSAAPSGSRRASAGARRLRERATQDAAPPSTSDRLGARRAPRRPAARRAPRRRRRTLASSGIRRFAA